MRLQPAAHELRGRHDRRAGARQAPTNPPTRDAFLRPRATLSASRSKKLASPRRTSCDHTPSGRRRDRRNASCIPTPSLTSRRSPAPSADSAQIRHTPARSRPSRRVAFATMDALRALPSVDRLAAELDAPHAARRVAARAMIDERRAELRAGRGRRARPARPRARARSRRTQRPLAPPRDQRDRRDRPHQPRPRAARRAARDGGRARRRRLLEPRVGRRDRHARLAPRPRRGACSPS